MENIFFLRWCVGGAGVNDFFYKESKLKKFFFFGGGGGGEGGARVSEFFY